MTKVRLDKALVLAGLCETRSQAENYIKLGHVKLGSVIITKPGQIISGDKLSELSLIPENKYVSRAALKLESVANELKLTFKNKTVLDVGSSTGGFTDYAIQHGAKKVIAVEQGSNQMHDSIRDNSRVELHEKTDIRGFKTANPVDIVLIDVSFISIRDVLLSLPKILKGKPSIIAMVKPQFEAAHSSFKHKGVIKNEKMRRQIFKDFENWSKDYFVIKSKADSKITGAKGNLERFYYLTFL